MIWDSSHWKDGLLDAANQFDQIASRRCPSEKLLVELEKTVFLAAYAIRKLMEAKLLSTKNESQPVPARAYQASGKPVTITNWHNIDRLYDLDNTCKTTLTLRELCNQLIHSYVFLPLATSKTGPVKAVMFSSDRSRNKQLFEVSLHDLAKILRIVGRDYPACSNFLFDEKVGDYHVTSWTPSE